MIDVGIRIRRATTTTIDDNDDDSGDDGGGGDDDDDIDDGNGEDDDDDDGDDDDEYDDGDGDGGDDDNDDSGDDDIPLSRARSREGWRRCPLEGEARKQRLPAKCRLRLESERRKEGSKGMRRRKDVKEEGKGGKGKASFCLGGKVGRKGGDVKGGEGKGREGKERKREKGGERNIHT